MAKRLATQVLIGAFTDEEMAHKIERLVCDEEWDSKQILCTNMAIAKKDIAGKTFVKELGAPSKERAADGDVEGLISGLGLMLLGPTGVVAGKRASIKAGAAGTAAVATYGAHKVEGMDKNKLATLGSALGRGNSAIVLVFDEVLVSKSDFDNELELFKESTDRLMEIVASKIKENLKEGNDITFHITLDKDGVKSTRTVTGKDAKEIRKIVLSQDSLESEQITTTDKGVYTSEAIITPEAVATRRTKLTSSVCAYEYDVAAITEDAAYFESGKGATRVTTKKLEP